MKVAFRLRRRPEVDPAVAWLFPSYDLAPVLGLCAGLGFDPTGRIHVLADGLLLHLEEPTDRVVAGVVRLRRLAPDADLFLPVDAELIPALLDDEAEGLTRRQGLVFLPDGRVLGFDPRGALAPAALLTGSARPGRPWRPFPARPALAERIEEIALVLTGESPESVLDAGAGQIGTEEPRPDAAGPGATLVGGATLGAGRGLAWLGGALGLEGLARLGARLIGQAQNLAPRLSEAVLGRQDAALRALLREFREGDIERALRRALPLLEPGGPRGAVVDAGDQLPTHKATYTLNDLMGPSGRGPAAVWSGGQDIMVELAREYRKAALQAIQAGDFRRAAFIYGKLLKDYRAAAHALLRGGLHHDAAVLMLAKLDDQRGAALAFEAAGEFDRAVGLYRGLSDHVAAGDLLRRLGEDEAALAEFRLAAERLVHTDGGHLAAGDLLLNKAGDCDLARAHFELGWGRRPERNAVSCGLRLLRLDLEAGRLPAVRRLLDQADTFFASHGDLFLVGRFYNELAMLADRAAAAADTLGGAAGREEAAAVHDELRDRALCGLASELRVRARPGAAAAELVATLSRRPDTWPASLISDADFALSAATSRAQQPPAHPPRPADSMVRWFQAGRGTVTAFCTARESGEVFLGFSEGEVLVVHPDRAEVARVADYDLAVTALAAAPDGSTLITLRSSSAGRGVLSTYQRDPAGSYRSMLGTVLAVEGQVHPGLTPILSRVGGDRVGLRYGRELHLLSVASLTWEGCFTLPYSESSPPVLLLRWPRPDPDEEGLAAFTHDGEVWILIDSDGDLIHSTGLRWQPERPGTSTLRTVPISWKYDSPEHLEIAGLGESGALHWAAFRRGESSLQLHATNVATVEDQEQGYLAAAFVHSHLVAGVTRSRIDWLRTGPSKFALRRSTRIALPSAVACLPGASTNTLVVICADGLIARVTVPV
jgi:hypothetical protein